MSPKRVAVITDKAPKPRPGIHNQGIIANGLVYTSGMTAKDLTTGVIIGGTIEDRTHHCIRSLGAILEAAGSSLDDVIEVNLYLTNLGDFDRVNAVYTQYWGELKPARTCIIVKNLPGNTDVEIKCIGLVVKDQPSSKL